MAGASFGIVLGGIVGTLLGWGVSSEKLQAIESDLESNTAIAPCKSQKPGISIVLIRGKASMANMQISNAC